MGKKIDQYFYDSKYVLKDTYVNVPTVLHTTVGPTNVYKKSEGQIM